MSRRSMARAMLASIVGLMTIVALLPVASAHDPIFVTDEQTSPETGPYFPDGAISWAIYGSFADADDTRGFEFDLRDGEDLYISLLIPNKEPELSLTLEELPWMEVFLPDGDVIAVEPEFGEVFDEAFSGTSYVTLFEDVQPAIGGRHQVIVHSRAPSRFSVAVGQREEFGTPAERTVDRPAGFTEFAAPLNAWWNTPPGEEMVEGGEQIDVDIEAAEEALDELAAEAEAEATTTTTSAPTTTVSSTAVESSALADEAPDDDGGGGAAWVIPLAVVVAIVGGAIAVMRRRSSEA